METRYDPAVAEDKWYSLWLEKGLFTPRPGGGKPFVIVMPPPNVTGPLTMGHVLNMTLQDVLANVAIVGDAIPGRVKETEVEVAVEDEENTVHDLQLCWRGTRGWLASGDDGVAGKGHRNQEE